MFSKIKPKKQKKNKKQTNAFLHCIQINAVGFAAWKCFGWLSFQQVRSRVSVVMGKKNLLMYSPSGGGVFFSQTYAHGWWIFGVSPPARINRKRGCKSFRAAEISPPNWPSSSTLQCMMGSWNDRSEHERFNGCSAPVRRYQWLRGNFPVSFHQFAPNLTSKFSIKLWQYIRPQ